MRQHIDETEDNGIEVVLFVAIEILDVLGATLIGAYSVLRDLVFVVYSSVDKIFIEKLTFVGVEGLLLFISLLI